MVYIIVRKTSGELRQSLTESRSETNLRASGRVRNAEEAVEVADRIRRETGKEITLAVAGDSAESKQARIDLAQRAGFAADPEAVQERM